MGDTLSSFDNGERRLFSEDFKVAVRKDESVNLKISRPMKRALKAIAARTGFSVSDLIRHLIVVYMDSLYNGYDEFFNKYYEEEVSELEKGGVQEK